MPIRNDMPMTLKEHEAWEVPPSVEKKYKTVERSLKDDPHFKKCY
jgi:hypothetical protein